MAKTANLHLRLEPAERAVLEAAAQEDDRTVSQLARRIIMEWAKRRQKATDRAVVERCDEPHERWPEFGR